MSSSQIPEAISSWREELIGYLKEVYNFSQGESDTLEVVKKLSSYSARASYMRITAVRSNNRDMMNFRINEIDPFLKEVELQFRIWSRVGALIKDEHEMTKY